MRKQDVIALAIAATLALYCGSPSDTADRPDNDVGEGTLERLRTLDADTVRDALSDGSDVDTNTLKIDKAKRFATHGVFLASDQQGPFYGELQSDAGTWSVTGTIDRTIQEKFFSQLPKGGSNEVRVAFLDAGGQDVLVGFVDPYVERIEIVSPADAAVLDAERPSRAGGMIIGTDDWLLASLLRKGTVTGAFLTAPDAGPLVAPNGEAMSRATEFVESVVAGESDSSNVVSIAPKDALAQALELLGVPELMPVGQGRIRPTGVSFELAGQEGVQAELEIQFVEEGGTLQIANFSYQRVAIP